MVKGHSRDNSNKAADTLALKGAIKDAPNKVDLSVPNHLDLQGAKLASMIQLVANQGIKTRAVEIIELHTGATICLDIMQGTLKVSTRSYKTNKSLWHGYHNTNISLKIKQILFKAMHNTLMCYQWLCM